MHNFWKHECSIGGMTVVREIKLCWPCSQNIRTNKTSDYVGLENNKYIIKVEYKSVVVAGYGWYSRTGFQTTQGDKTQSVVRTKQEGLLCLLATDGIIQDKLLWQCLCTMGVTQLKSWVLIIIKNKKKRKRNIDNTLSNKMYSSIHAFFSTHFYLSESCESLVPKSTVLPEQVTGPSHEKNRRRKNTHT